MGQSPTTTTNKTYNIKPDIKGKVKTKPKIQIHKPHKPSGTPRMPAHVANSHYTRHASSTTAPWPQPPSFTGEDENHRVSPEHSETWSHRTHLFRLALLRRRASSGLSRDLIQEPPETPLTTLNHTHLIVFCFNYGELHQSDRDLIREAEPRRHEDQKKNETRPKSQSRWHEAERASTPQSQSRQREAKRASTPESGVRAGDDGAT